MGLRVFWLVLLRTLLVLTSIGTIGCHIGNNNKEAPLNRRLILYYFLLFHLCDVLAQVTLLGNQQWWPSNYAVGLPKKAGRWGGGERRRAIEVTLPGPATIIKKDHSLIFYFFSIFFILWDQEFQHFHLWHYYSL